jgi:hypothetical protein
MVREDIALWPLSDLLLNSPMRSWYRTARRDVRGRIDQTNERNEGPPSSPTDASGSPIIAPRSDQCFYDGRLTTVAREKFDSYYLGDKPGITHANSGTCLDLLRHIEPIKRHINELRCLARITRLACKRQTICRVEPIPVGGTHT